MPGPNTATFLDRLVTLFQRAINVSYDPTASGLTATDVQAAIDEIAAGGGGGPSPSDSTPESVAASGSAGVASAYSRGDHVHASPTLSTVLATGNLSGDNNIEMRNGSSVLFRPVGDGASLAIAPEGTTPADARISIGGTYSSRLTAYQPVAPAILEMSDVLSYEYGGIGNGSAGILTFTLTGHDGTDAFFIRYQVLLCAGPNPPGGIYNDELKPIVVGSDWSSDPGFSVTLSGTSPNRAINFEHTGAATVDVNLFLESESFQFTVPTP